MAVNTTRIVIDTNILISALVYGGKPRDLLELVIIRQIAGITSLFLLAELVETLTRKFNFSPQKVYQIERKIRKSFKFVRPNKILEVVRDKDDNRVLEAAVEGECDYIVTGDRDLLDLGRYEKIKIVTSVQFLEEMKTSGQT